MKVDYKNRRSRAGFLFVLPWIIGFLIFFVQPMILLVKLAFTDMAFGEAGGYVLNPLENVFDNFKYIFVEDSYFGTYLLESFGSLLYKIPFIILFGLFSATVLNKDFHGKVLMRVIFFLPIVIGSGLVMNVIQNNSDQITMVVEEESSMFNTAGLVDMLLIAGLPEKFVSIITTMVSGVADLVWESSIQILVFLVALLSVPQSYYEVATVEGAKSWETFWKVTFPTVTPYVLAMTVYTIIDSFTNVDNKIMEYIVSVSNTQIEYSKAAAMAWIFFAVVIFVILAVFLLFKPFVFEKNSKSK